MRLDYWHNKTAPWNVSAWMPTHSCASVLEHWTLEQLLAVWIHSPWFSSKSDLNLLIFRDICFHILSTRKTGSLSPDRSTVAQRVQWNSRKSKRSAETTEKTITVTGDKSFFSSTFTLLVRWACENVKNCTAHALLRVERVKWDIPEMRYLMCIAGLWRRRFKKSVLDKTLLCVSIKKKVKTEIRCLFHTSGTHKLALIWEGSQFTYKTFCSIITVSVTAIIFLAC